MISRWARQWSGRIFRPAVSGLVRAGVTPNQLSIGSLIVTVLAGLSFAWGSLAAGAWLFLLGGLLDSLDGELARSQGLEAPLGAFLDSICDHVGDFVLAAGLSWHFLGMGARTEAMLILAGLFGSVFGSQVRSRAGMLGIDLKRVGSFTRMERTLVLSFGILLGLPTLALWILAVANNLSALERALAAVRAARQRPPVLAPSPPEVAIPEDRR